MCEIRKKRTLDHLPIVPIATYEEPLGKDLMSRDRIGTESRVSAVSGQFSTDLLALNEKLKSMMRKSPNIIKTKNQSRQTAMICKVCQKEGRAKDI